MSCWKSERNSWIRHHLKDSISLQTLYILFHINGRISIFDHTKHNTVLQAGHRWAVAVLDLVFIFFSLHCSFNPCWTYIFYITFSFRYLCSMFACSTTFFLFLPLSKLFEMCRHQNVIISNGASNITITYLFTNPLRTSCVYRVVSTVTKQVKGMWFDPGKRHKYLWGCSLRKGVEEVLLRHPTGAHQAHYERGLRGRGSLFRIKSCNKFIVGPVQQTKQINMHQPLWGCVRKGIHHIKSLKTL